MIERLDFNISFLSSLTLIPVILIIFLFIIRIYKVKEIKSFEYLYLLVFLNSLLIMSSLLLKEFNSYSIKMIIYNIFICILINILKDKTLNKMCLIMIVTSFVLSVDIIFNGLILIGNGTDLVNLRSYTLMDKQYYTILYSVSIPICFFFFFENKRNYVYLIILLVSVVACVIFMQIKTLIITVPIAIYFMLYKAKLISIKNLLLQVVVLVSILSYLVITQNKMLNQFYVIFYYLFGLNDKIPVEYLKYIDTLLIREQIFSNAFMHLKDNFLLGLGYGNYSSIVEGLSIRSLGRNIFYDLPMETESGLLLFLIEGGIIGLILHLLIYAYFFYMLKKQRIIFDRVNLSILSIVIVNLLSNIMQDNLNFLYWFFLGAGLYVVTKRSVTYSGDNKDEVKK